MVVRLQGDPISTHAPMLGEYAQMYGISQIVHFLDLELCTSLQAHELPNVIDYLDPGLMYLGVWPSFLLSNPLNTLLCCSPTFPSVAFAFSPKKPLVSLF